MLFQDNICNNQWHSSRRPTDQEPMVSPPLHLQKRNADALKFDSIKSTSISYFYKDSKKRIIHALSKSIEDCLFVIVETLVI